MKNGMRDMQVLNTIADSRNIDTAARNEMIGFELLNTLNFPSRPATIMEKTEAQIAEQLAIDTDKFISKSIISIRHRSRRMQLINRVNYCELPTRYFKLLVV
jgi:hypothetical protein